MRNRKRDRYDKLHRRGEVWYTKVKLERDGRWHEISLGTTDKDEAERIREQKIRDFLEERELPDIAVMTVEKAAERWLTDRKVEVATNTHRIDKERMKPIIKSLGGRRLDSLRPVDLRQYQRDRRQQVSARTTNLET